MRLWKYALAAAAACCAMLPAALFAGCGKAEGKDFRLVEGDRAAVICVEGTNAPGATDGDYPGVVRAAYDLQSDVERITGVKPAVTKALERADYAVIAGTLGKSKNIDRIVKAGKLDVSEIEGKWESYLVKTVHDPFGDGSVKTALVVAGSDKRGSIYGIYKISEEIGMTPWAYFADSVPETREDLTFAKDYSAVGREPAVKYRGIFINDEECLEQWARVLDEGKHLGPNLYEKLFEMLLRIHANYLWPGMHACSDAFSDYPENPVNADYYGIVIGTSHCDMLLRNNLNEWDAFKTEYRSLHPEAGDIEYDYTVNPEAIREYWRQSVEENKDYEVQWTLGMRGAHDEPFTARNINNAPWYGDKNMLMEQIIADQRDILRDVLENPTLEDVFMMFIPYKEVQTLYNDGLEVPEDVTIMWADDNHGFIRNLPNEEERARSGGLGVYYHNSYWGPDNESYMWINSMPNTMVYEEMSKALAYGIDRAWILNSGDTIPYMPEIEFFVDYAYRAEEYNDENVFQTYVGMMASREFGEEFAGEVTEICKRYTQLTNSRKLEQMSVDLFTSDYGDEAERRAAQYKALWERAEKVYAEIPERQRDCFYETVLFEVRCAYFINAEFYYAHKGNVAYAQGRNATANNCYNLSKEFNQKRKDEISYYNVVLQGGKWKNLVDPEVYHSPVMAGFASGGPTFALGAPEAGVVAEGEILEQDGSVLEFGNFAKGRKYFDVFNRGGGSFTFTVTADPFIVLDISSHTVTDEQRVWVSVDWDKVTGTTQGTVVITADGYRKEISVRALVNELRLGEKTYVEQDGYVSMEAEHYSASRSTPENGWEIVKDLGRGEGDMVRAESRTLVGYGEKNFEAQAPYLEYNVWFEQAGKFETEIYRLPTLNSLGRVRFAVSADAGMPVIVEGERDYGTNNPAWEEGVFTQIIKHRVTLDIPTSGMHRIRLYMLDPFITIDKLVIYTAERRDSYFGPVESYNSTYNPAPWEKADYAPFYESKYELPATFDLGGEYGNGYFVEQGGKLSIEAESAAIEGTGVSITNGRWLPARTIEGISMRTEKLRDDFDGVWEKQAPAMNYELIITTPGNYNLWVCLNAPCPRSSVYAIGVDGRYRFLQTTYSYSREETFQWLKAGTQLSFPAAGKYTLNFYCSQDGLAVDRMYLTRTGETPDSAAFRQSPRTTVWTDTVSDSAEDGARRKALSDALYAAGNYCNVVTGTGVGEYGAEEYEALLGQIAHCRELILRDGALTDAEASDAASALSSAYDALVASRKMTDGKTDYLVYETWEKATAGLAPFGFTYRNRYLSPDVSVAEENGEKFFRLRTFNEQNNLETVSVSYDFAPVTGKLSMTARMSFNEAEWGSLYLLNENGENSVCIAFECAYNSYNIVAYDGNSKKILAGYERNVPVEIGVEADVAENVFDVTVNGEKVAEGFLFRSGAYGLAAVSFGSATRNADLRMYRLTVKAE